MNSLDRSPAKQVVDGTSQGRSHSDSTQEYTVVKKKKFTRTKYTTLDLITYNYFIINITYRVYLEIAKIIFHPKYIQ